MIRRLTLLTNPDQCNLRCPLCFLQQSGRKFGMGEMPFEVARRAVEKALRDSCLQEVIPSTMGEPLLYSHFSELLELCRSLNVPVNLTTNGSFPGGWGSEDAMRLLLESCSDVKVSCMGWGGVFERMMPGISFAQWTANVKRLVACRALCVAPATVSLQVTLHKENARFAEDILHWAEGAGISRVKWNLPFFLSVSPDGLRESFDVSREEVLDLRRRLVSDSVLCEGNLFYGGESREVGGRCRFADELWVLPDGSGQSCPNPERRFGNALSDLAKCENCPMRG